MRLLYYKYNHQSKGWCGLSTQKSYHGNKEIWKNPEVIPLTSVYPNLTQNPNTDSRSRINRNLTRLHNDIRPHVAEVWTRSLFMP